MAQFAFLLKYAIYDIIKYDSLYCGNFYILLSKEEDEQNKKGGILIMESRKGKVCGIIGGMSHESSDKIGEILHETANDYFGKQSSADYAQRDVDFERITQKMEEGDWAFLTGEMVEISKWLMAGGVDYVAIISNTMHRTADAVTAVIGEEHFLHIGDCIAYECKAKKDVKKVLLLGTKETMSGSSITKRLEKHGLVVCTPRECYHDMLNRIIFKELVRGRQVEASRNEYIAMIQNSLADNCGVDAVILGCTELNMLLEPFELEHRKDIWEYNMANPPHTSMDSRRDGKPFFVIDSSQAQINCLKRVVCGLDPF